MLQKIVDNVLVDVDHVIAVFVYRPNQFQHQIVVLFDDGQKEILWDGFTPELFKNIREKFNNLEYLVKGVDFVCKTDLVEMIRYDSYRQILSIKIKSYVVTLEFVDNLKL